MNTTTIILGSVTYSIKARKLLEKNGIKSKLVKVDSAENGSGCSYGIKFPSIKLYDAVMLLKENNFRYSVHTEKRK